MSTSAFLDPDIVEGPRKRRPTERVLENGDPLSNKRSKTSNKSSVDRRASIEDVEEPAPPPRSCPRDPTRILEHSDGSDDAANISVSLPGLVSTEASSAESTDNEDSDDDDEPELIDDTEELRMCPVTPVNPQDQCTKYFHRKACEGLGRTNLCFFQAHTYYPVP